MGGLEWRMTVGEGSSEELVPQASRTKKLWLMLMELILALKLRIWRFLERIWKIGVDDPRRVIHCFKVGLSLSIVSLFYYVRPLYDGVGGNSMWAVMTVVVVFEYTVGGTLSKGLNRGMATLTAGTLAVLLQLIARASGEKAQPVVLSISVFLIASAATFTRFIPTIKRRFDYGVTIFILTFSFVSVSAYRVDKLVDLARLRLTTIVIGSSLCIIVNMLVRPVWAGQELHLLITCNTEKIAIALDGCVAGYFMDDATDVDYKESCQKSQGYKCVLNSKTMEESFANFARWEPAHSQFSFRHPWKQYLKIGTTLRHCAYCIEALNASIDSDIKIPDFLKKYFSNACINLGSHYSIILNELAKTTKIMTKSSTIDFMVSDMNNGVEELRNAMKFLPNQLIPQPSPPTSGEANEEKRQLISFMEVIPLVTVASLLIEIAGRIEGVVNAVDELAELANFKLADEGKASSKQSTGKPNLECQEQELASMKTLQRV